MSKETIEEELNREISQSEGRIELVFAPQKEYHFTFDFGSFGDLIVRFIDWVIRELEKNKPDDRQ